jgi:hypothetical protein
MHPQRLHGPRVWVLQSGQKSRGLFLFSSARGGQAHVIAVRLLSRLPGNLRIAPALRPHDACQSFA